MISFATWHKQMESLFFSTHIPTTQDHSLIPWYRAWYIFQSLSNSAYQVVGIIIQLLFYVSTLNLTTATSTL